MINAFYSAVSGSKSLQSSLDVSANNIANANTAGYQAQQTNFADLVYTGISSPEDGAASIKTGNGVRVSAISTVLGAGAIEETGREYDFAILGEGYFGVSDSSGNTYYTRNGNFYLDTTGEDNYLVTANGDRVLDADLAPITVADLTAPAEEAAASGEESDTSEAITPGVFAFANPYALLRDGNGRLSASAASGEGQADSSIKVKGGVLESSNVDMVQEMSDMMQAQRSFQFSAKLIQAADELENIANSLRS